MHRLFHQILTFCAELSKAKSVIFVFRQMKTIFSFNLDYTFFQYWCYIGLQLN